MPFVVTGLTAIDNGAVTFSDGNAAHNVTVQIVGGVPQAATADLSGMSDGPVSSILTLNPDAAGNSFTPVAGNTVTLYQDTGAGQIHLLNSSFGANTVVADTNTGLRCGMSASRLANPMTRCRASLELDKPMQDTVTLRLRKFSNCGPILVCRHRRTPRSARSKQISGVGDVWYDGTREVSVRQPTAYRAGRMKRHTGKLALRATRRMRKCCQRRDRRLRTPPAIFPTALRTRRYWSSNSPFDLRRAGGVFADSRQRRFDADWRGGRGSVAFAIAGLGTEDTGTVTFTDANNKAVTVDVTGSQTSYTADLSGLADGAITSSLQVALDSAGNSFQPVAGNSVALDQDKSEQTALHLTVNPTIAGGFAPMDFSNQANFTGSARRPILAAKPASTFRMALLVR